MAFDKRAYKREWMRKRREDFFSGKSCVLCSSTSNLELDHIIPSEKLDHRIWSWRKERREAELTKCQVLCRPCHIEKSLIDGTRPTRTHGNSGYRRGCRCSICREAAVAKVNEYRWRTGRRKKRKI